MSDWDDDIDDLLGDPAQDNNVVRVLREKIKADKAAMRTMREQIETLQADRATNVLNGALSSAGIDTRYAKFYQGDPDPAKISAWIDENKDLFATAVQQPNQVPENTAPPQMPGGPMNVGDQPEPAITPDTQAAMMRMMGMNGVDGIPPSNYNDILGKLSGAADEDAFKQALRQFGGPSY